jgi:aspartate aminotransferase
MNAANATTSHPRPINLALGEPAENPAPDVIEAAVRTIRDGLVRYSPPSGLPRLRELGALDQCKKSGIDRRLEEVLITPGGKPALSDGLRCLLGPGDEALVLAPYWPSYLQQVTCTGARYVVVEPGPDLLPRPDAIDAACTPRTKLLILNDPSNPTSRALAPERLRRIAEVAERHDLWIVADQVYDDLVLEGDHAPLLKVAPELRKRTLVVESFSKRFAMTGYRLGYACGPQELIEAMTQLISAATTCANTIAQHAGIAALSMDDTWIDEQRTRYRQRRDLALAAIGTIDGLECERPEAAFYLFPELCGPRRDDERLVTDLREREGVLLVPGSSFGLPGRVRLSCSVSADELNEALGRLATFFATSQTPT